MEYDKVDKLIKLLSDEKYQYIPLIQRKEVSAWTSTVFFIAILWALYNFIAVHFEVKLDMVSIITKLFIPMCFLYIIGKFIQAQFASIYDWNARNDVLREELFNLIINGKPDYLNDYKKFFEKYNRDIRDKKENDIQQFIGKKHPIKILYFFWRFIFILPLLNWIYCKIRKKRTPRKLNNIERQEAALYSLIILTTMVYYLIILKIVFFTNLSTN
jgi:hypothetical protein